MKKHTTAKAIFGILNICNGGFAGYEITNELCAWHDAAVPSAHAGSHCIIIAVELFVFLSLFILLEGIRRLLRADED
jgi:hypothetical protein